MSSPAVRWPFHISTTAPVIQFPHSLEGLGLERRLIVGMAVCAAT